MAHVSIHNIRCFSAADAITIAPLTVIIGENSTGKSTFLALIRIIRDIMAGDLDPDFNEEPFLLGSFDQIATYRGGRGGRASSFSVSIELPPPSTGAKAERIQNKVIMEASFLKSGSQPNLSKLSIASGAYSFSMQFGTAKRDIRLVINTPSWSGEISKNLVEELTKGIFADEARVSTRTLFNVLVAYLNFLNLRSSRAADAKNINHLFAADEAQIASTDWQIILDMIVYINTYFPGRPRAIAPVRSKPRRSYDPVKATRDPDGEHVPLILAKMSYSKGKRWDELRAMLNAFGQSSGLFDDIAVRRLGREDSNPFQIQIKIAGPASNLIDVGYGVSQALPILVDALESEKGSVFLLQQPEVHLHPRGQADLATLFAGLVKKEKKVFFIETHSDYFLDRLRVLVREGKTLNSDDISILFFERRGMDVLIHSMSIDQDGNMQNVPNTYRRFFLEEENRLLGI